MNSRAQVAGILAAALLTTSALAQNADEYDQDRPPRRATKIPTEGFWPTQKMMDRVIDRITDQMAKHYEFDDNQLELTRDLFKDRFPSFLNENRAEIQTLMNQYFEALLDTEPPPVEAVAEWAQRVQPLLAEFDEVATEVTEGMREYLTDEQVTMLDAESAAFQAGMTMAQNKLSVWAEGGYDPETEWIHSRSNRRERDRAEDATPATEGAEADDSELADSGAAKTPKDEWTIYTERFIERYDLDVEQKQKAFAFLRRQQEARDKYLRGKADEMARVTKLLSEAQTEEERQAALAAYSRLNAPVDRMFEQLKDRLNTLPTRAQRKAAADAGLETEGKESSKPAKEPLTEEDRKRLESVGYLEPPATQPDEPAP